MGQPFHSQNSPIASLDKLLCVFASPQMIHNSHYRFAKLHFMISEMELAVCLKLPNWANCTSILKFSISSVYCKSQVLYCCRASISFTSLVQTTILITLYWDCKIYFIWVVVKLNVWNSKIINSQLYTKKSSKLLSMKIVYKTQQYM